MQFYTPTRLAAALVVAVGLAQSLAAAQQSSTANSSTKSSSSNAPASSGTSQTTVAVEPAPHADGSPAEGKAAPDTKDNNSIHVSVNEVIVPVTVTDDKGRFVSDLDAKDFHIFEENKPQTIRFFTRERSQPVVIGFLIDLSTASRIHWKNFQAASEELIQNLLTGDPKYSGYLIDYAQDAEVAVNTTTDPEPIVEKIRKLKPGGGSALYDA